MLSWLWGYWNNVMDHKEKEIQILRLTARVQNLEGILNSIKYIMDNKENEDDDN
jgi:hypothetical protein